MMRTIVLVGLLLLLITAPIQAQEQSYRLRTPDPAEYVERIVEIAIHSQEDWWTRTLYSTLTDLVFRRFPNLDQVDYHRIRSAYDAMGIGQDGSFWERGQWVEAIVSAWLQQAQPDLGSTRELRFDDFVIGVLPYDFDADGQNEYVLDVVKGEPTDRYDCRYQAEYVNYLVVQLTDSEYRLVETPLYWEGYGNIGGSNFGEGGQVEYRFEDINADGLPEWLVLVGGETFGGPQSGYENVGQLYILSWRDGRLVDLAALDHGRQYQNSATYYTEDSYGCDSAVPRDVTWEFTNIDGDATQEILQHQVYLDNWQCIARITKVIDWDAGQDQYVQVDVRRDFPEDSQNCVRRQAEEAMWVGNYEEALEHYERAIALSPYIDPREKDPDVGEYSRELIRNRRLTYEQYHMARMALAYQLVGQPENARPILDTLSEQEFSSEPVQIFVQGLSDAPDTPFGACLAAYTTFAEHYDVYLFGITLERYYGNDARYSPSRIGCDVLPLLSNELNTRIFTTDVLPVEHVTDLGLSVRDVIQEDLNGDGRYEWLVWGESPLNPFFFTPIDGSRYAVSTPGIDPFDNADDIHLWTLPDTAGMAVAYLIQGFDRYYPEPWTCAYNSWVCELGGPGDACFPDGYTGLNMWRMEGHELVPMMVNADVCRTDFEALFPGGEGSTQLDGGELIRFEANRSDPVIYTWDSTRQTFIESIPSVEATPVLTVVSTSEPEYQYFGEALDAGDYLAALTMLDQNAALEQVYYQQHAGALHTYQYQRAFILERLNRWDEALAEYISIYESAPDTPWGMLASLHLERSN